MAQAKPTGVLPAEEVAEMFQIDFKNRALAALLAWLIPGAGHLYQGRTAKGLLLMLCITSTFVFGFYLGGGKVAYATPLTMQQIQQSNDGGFLRNRFTQAIDRWPFLCQAGIGSVAMPAVVERQRYLAGKGPLSSAGWFYPPLPASAGPFESRDSQDQLVQHASELAKWNSDMGFFFELGTIYTVVAGLLNILAIYDAYSGPLVPVVASEDQGEEKDKKNEQKSKA